MIIKKECEKHPFREFPSGPVVRTLYFIAVAQVQSVIRELRSQGVAKKTKKNQKTKLSKKVLACTVRLEK